MSMLTHKQNVKIISIVLVLALVFITEPLLAKKGRSRQSRSSNEHSKSQSREKASTPRKAPKPRNTSNRRSKVAASRTRKVQPSFQSRMTVSKQPARSKPKRSLAAPKRSVNTIRGRKSAPTNFSARRQSAVKSVKRKRSTNSRSIKINKRTSERTYQRPAGNSKPTIRAVGRTKKTRNQITRKSRIVAKVPETRTIRKRTTRSVKVDKTNADSANQVSLAGRTETNLSRKIRRSRKRSLLTTSPFLRPRHKRSLRTRLASEKNRHIRMDIRQRRSIRRDYLPVIRERLRERREKRRHSKVIYYERNRLPRRPRRYEYVYNDYYGQLCYRTIWPRYRFFVYYNLEPWFTFRYVYPYYHRKYIFVSLGGYWPINYRYLRYYWYNYHPYYWYGYYPVAREVRGDTYNYYTYNYYGSDIRPVDQTTFQDVRERLAQQDVEEPETETLADIYFDEAVKAFEEGDYQTAVEKFTQAMELAPDDRILPFAYSQALFANEQYAEAAGALRGALAYVTPEEEGIFYPRGLYSDEETLIEQIKLLVEKAQLHPFEANFQLLLGYQLFGVGELEAAVEPLTQARFDSENKDSAAVLLGLLEKIKIAEQNQGNSK